MYPDGSSDRDEFETGVNYVIDGHNARVSLIYQYGDLSSKGIFDFGPDVRGDSESAVKFVWQTPGTVEGDAWSDYLEGSKDIIADWTSPIECGNYNEKTKSARGRLIDSPWLSESEARGEALPARPHERRS